MMSANKRTKCSSEALDSDAVVQGESGAENQIVGLKMADGKIFYCCQSMLAKASPQFFTMKPIKQDSDGINIYFAGGDSELFQSHILPYLLLRTNESPPKLPDNPEMRRRLHDEAVFYGLNDLVAALNDKLSRNSDIVGLEFTDGGVCYCPRSTLTNSPYFANRFGGSFDDDIGWYDSQGRPVYFIDRNGELFRTYIVEYLRTCDPELPPFLEDPKLWRALRKEALYYGLDGLTALLQVTHTCEPNDDTQGILYWKGTKRGKSEEYRNPNEIGAVRVGGWIDWTDEERTALRRDGNNRIFPLAAWSAESRNSLVQHCPSVYGVSDVPNVHNAFCSTVGCANLTCGHSFLRVPTTLDLKTISVRLTHYSLRYDDCGMTHWNFEGSEDGEDWVVLHAARNDPHLRQPSAEYVNQIRQIAMSNIENGLQSEKQAADTLLSYAEPQLRHTWTIDPLPTAFYRYFRLIGIGEEHDGIRCLHGVGLELFGDVHED